MELMQAIYDRRAIRNFTDQEVPRLTLLEFMNAPIQAPSAVDQQPWAFAVFQGRERLKSHSGRAKGPLLTISQRQ